MIKVTLIPNNQIFLLIFLILIISGAALLIGSMDGGNHSVVSEFVFLGLTNSWESQLFLLVFSSVFYVASMTGNILIVFSVTSDPHLHSPLYFLLASLSFIDLGACNTTSPKTIYDLFRKHKVISFGGCVTQVFFIHVLGGVEMVLLIAMAFDRYVAICKPLHYLTIMNPQMCILFLAVAWALAHITVVFFFFGPTVFVYTWPHPNSQMDKFLAIFDAVLTPFLNPVIYTFRNKETKTAMKRVFRPLVIFRKIS
ncbi:olfactory receptor 4F3/4F16/4F29-like [Trichechus manatus latirostris]|uniref:Olfactory receptor n=1 Tax=Trichechus manatus latirostris TaxID=127582 RepID=A0A2Y9QQZ9_TRIMA|nr:olfactory receptor 4F3/4F16/4F29-like [Trichechus manatus latirostris]